jgi:hypothetical protein
LAEVVAGKAHQIGLYLLLLLMSLVGLGSSVVLRVVVAVAAASSHTCSGHMHYTSDIVRSTVRSDSNWVDVFQDESFHTDFPVSVLIVQQVGTDVGYVAEGSAYWFRLTKSYSERCPDTIVVAFVRPDYVDSVSFPHTSDVCETEADTAWRFDVVVAEFVLRDSSADSGFETAVLVRLVADIQLLAAAVRIPVMVLRQELVVHIERWEQEGFAVSQTLRDPY